eukprot:142561-Rhodomonas_salina.1
MALCGNGIGKERRSVARKARRDGADAAAAAAINELEMEDDDLEQALFLMSSSANKRSIGEKPLPRDSIMIAEFKLNLLLSHSTFLELRLVKLLAPDVLDSVNQLTGHVYVTKEFKVAVALHHLGHTANCCSTGIGVATAK